MGAVFAVLFVTLLWGLIVALSDIDPADVNALCEPHRGVREIHVTTWSQPDNAVVVCKDGTVAEVQDS